MPSIASPALAAAPPVRRRRLLVVANDPAGPGDVLALLDGPPATVAEVLVVAPMLNSWGGRLVVDPDGAERDAVARMEATTGALQAAGVPAGGVVGDADPLHATCDGLAVFDADEVVIATVAARLDGWLGETLAARARAHTPLPVRNAAVGRAQAEPVRGAAA